MAPPPPPAVKGHKTTTTTRKTSRRNNIRTTFAKKKSSPENNNPTSNIRRSFSLIVFICILIIIKEVNEFRTASYTRINKENQLFASAACGGGGSLLQLPILSSTHTPPQNFNASQLPKLTNSSLAIMVLSRRDHFRVRQVIRETWAKDHDNVYFVIGKGCRVASSLRVNANTSHVQCQVQDKPLPPDYKTLTQQQHLLEQEMDEKLYQEQEKHRDLILTGDYVDLYRTLPQKLKAAYTFVHDYLPSVDWVLKVDDDFYVRVDKIHGHIHEKYSGKTNPRTSPLVAGMIRTGWKAPTGGKWQEVPQYPLNGAYPPFPLGSAGHVVSRYVVEYIYQNQHLLFDYQGEDASVGIWLQDFGKKPFVMSNVMVNNAMCGNPDYFVIGHSLNMDEMAGCHIGKSPNRTKPVQPPPARNQKGPENTNLVGLSNRRRDSNSKLVPSDSLRHLGPTADRAKYRKEVLDRIKQTRAKLEAEREQRRAKLASV